MKKVFLILFFTGIVCPLFSQVKVEKRTAYNETFYYSIHTANMGLTLGGIRNNNYSNESSIGAYISVYGFYFDFLLSPAAYRGSKYVGEWKDSMAYALHGGFQIPIVECLQITPLLGVALYSEGTTDGYHYCVGRDGINNIFIAEKTYKGFDYGVQVQYSFTKNFPVQIVAMITRLCWYAGVGIRFDI